MLKIISSDKYNPRYHDLVDSETLGVARHIVDDVRNRGEAALREHAERLGDIPAGAPLLIGRKELGDALDFIPRADRELLERVAGRIRAFADAQRKSVSEIEVKIRGGSAGQFIEPVESAGCYAPGGRYPLPSSVLMTAVTARAAGVKKVIVASPRSSLYTLAAAAIADADMLLAAGGAQAIAALAYGAGSIPSCDIIVGPGNRYVAAAKRIVSGTVGIDLQAGPSELVVLADSDSDPAFVAMDLLAQAEHDADAVPILVAIGQKIADAVNREIARALASLPTRSTAESSLKNGFAVVVRDLDEAIEICDRIAPEHLSLQLNDAAAVIRRFKHYGALFIGGLSTEALGDYGAGPNHTLPTGRAARFTGGLSVFNFLRIRTWLQMHDAGEGRGIIADSARLGEIEGLSAHAASASMRLRSNR